jgi:hypothetical protein
MKVLLFVVTCMFLFASPAFSDGSLTHLRCKSGLISLGENKLEVLSKCGEPGSKDTIGRRVSGGSGYINTEVWTYNFGSHDFIHTLEFQGGTLKSIKRDNRGF